MTKDTRVAVVNVALFQEYGNPLQLTHLRVRVKRRDAQKYQRNR